MNLRVDTDVVRGGGKQVQAMAERLATTLTSAEATLSAAAANVGQPAVEKALKELLGTLRTAHPRVTTGLGAFAREVQIAATAIDQTDVELAGAVPEAP
jgi:hypothetical protein